MSRLSWGLSMKRDGFSKLLSHKAAKQQTRSYIKDSDLQIQLSPFKDPSTAENIGIFKSIYGHPSTQTKEPSSDQQTNPVEDICHDMKLAESSYNIMMEISSSIAEAYKDLKKKR